MNFQCHEVHVRKFSLCTGESDAFNKMRKAQGATYESLFYSLVNPTHSTKWARHKVPCMVCRSHIRHTVRVGLGY